VYMQSYPQHSFRLPLRPPRARVARIMMWPLPEWQATTSRPIVFVPRYAFRTSTSQRFTR
jgi:hypothetical protein